MLCNAVGGGGVSFPGKTCYEGVKFNVISITRGWVGAKFPGKKCYVTLEWPHTRFIDKWRAGQPFPPHNRTLEVGEF